MALYGETRERDEWQRGLRNRILEPGFYRRFYSNFVFLDGDDGCVREIQNRIKVDTLATNAAQRAIGVEEKIVRWPGYAYEAFALETVGCDLPGLERPGWMVASLADYLLFCFASEDENALDCYLMNFPALREWFMPLAETFPMFLPKEGARSRSQGRIVPIKRVEAAVGFKRYYLKAPESA